MSCYVLLCADHCRPTSSQRDQNILRAKTISPHSHARPLGIDLPCLGLKCLWVKPSSMGKARRQVMLLLPDANASWASDTEQPGHVVHVLARAQSAHRLQCIP